MVIDTILIRVDSMVNLNLMEMAISYSLLHEWFKMIHFVITHFLYTIEMNGLCKPNHFVNHETEWMMKMEVLYEMDSIDSIIEW